MPSTKFSESEINRAAQLKEQQLYREEGFRKAKPLKRTFDDYENHLFAFLIDLNICLLPVYIWAIEFILILTGLIPPHFFDWLFYLMYALLFFCSCVLMPLRLAATRGQTWGMQVVGIKLVDISMQEAPLMRLVLRELLGFGIPIMLFGYFFSITGLLVWWAVSILVVLASNKQQTLFDWVFSLIPVYVPSYKIRLGNPFRHILSHNEEQPVNEVEQPKEAEPEQKEEQKAEPANPVPSSSVSPIDLHIRSSYSDDASDDVEEIFKKAKQQNMRVISITDHNCARANAQALRFAAMYDIQYIPGMEADVSLNNQRVRILGYYIDWTNPVFDEIEKNSLKREKEASLKRAQAFEKLMNIRIDLDSILSKSRFQILTGADLTNMVFRNPRTRQLEPVQKAIRQAEGDEQKAREIFIEEYFTKGKPCYIERTYPDAISFIDAIHESGGMAVLSGWHVDELDNETLVDLIEAGLDGLEVFTPDVDSKTAAFLLKVASDEKLFVTAGSDYHGSKRPDRELGKTNCPAKGLHSVEVFTRALDNEKPDPNMPRA